MKKKYAIIVCTTIIFIFGSIFYNVCISKEKYFITSNLSFDSKTKFNWNVVSERYKNIIDLYDTNYKKNILINEALCNTNFNLDKVLDNLKINPNVYGRQLSIEYIANNKNEGIEIVNLISNAIIKENHKFNPKEYVKLNKKISINTDNIKEDKNLNVVIFGLWGFILGICISIIEEEICLLKKK